MEAPIGTGTSEEFSDIPISDDESNFVVLEEVVEDRQPLTETVINAGHLTIQALNRHRLNPMEVDIINSFIYDFLRTHGTENVLDPSRQIPSEIEINKVYHGRMSNNMFMI